MITMKNHSVTDHQKKLLQLLFQSHVKISIVEVSLIQDFVSPVNFSPSSTVISKRHMFNQLPEHRQPSSVRHSSCRYYRTLNS